MNFFTGALAGLAVGVFAPGIARKLKALWVEYTQKLKGQVQPKIDVKL